MPPTERISTSWREGRYLDRWMLVHVLAGFSGGLSNVVFALSERTVLLLGLVLLVAWEIVEYVLGVREAGSNRVIDVIVGFLGILGARWLAARLDLRDEWIAFVVASGVTAALATAGWLAYRRRVRSERAAT